MSLFQRRQSRAGKSLEHTLEAILDARGISYDAQAETENHEKPDFLFPSEAAYHDPAFPAAGLTLLASSQRDWLWRVSDFLDLVSERERRYFRVS